jgi:hypothetical protein
MVTEVFKRSISLLIPSALIWFVIQYYETGKLTVFGTMVYVVVFLLSSMAVFGFDIWWTRRFGSGKNSSIARGVLWLVAAICLYLFFRQFDRA